MRKQLEQIEAELADSTPLNKLHLTQKRIDIEAELKNLGGDEVDMDALEKAFIKNAADYAERKKIGYAAFRAVGVPSDILGKAGIKRGS